MGERIRWRNRAAAWIYDLIAEPLMDLAIPVWVAEAEADLEEEWAEVQEVAEAAYREGCADGYAEAIRDHGLRA